MDANGFNTTTLPLRQHESSLSRLERPGRLFFASRESRAGSDERESHSIHSSSPDSALQIEHTTAHRRTLLALYAVLTVCSVVGLIELGVTPLNATFLILLPLCFFATIKGFKDEPILVTLTIAGGVGVLLNVAMGIRGPGVFAWLLLAPAAVALFASRRLVVVVSTLCCATWLSLALTVPASSVTTWSQQRSHFILILLASFVLGWFNSRRLKQWQEEAAETVRSSEALIALLPMPAIILLDGTIDIVNEQACRLLKRTRGSLLGEALETIFPIEHDAGGEMVSFEVDLEGKRHTIELQKSTVELPRGRGTILVLIDKTEALEKERKERKKQLRQQDAERLELIGRLAGGVAHDFNNLLAAILLNKDLAELAVDNEDEALLRKCHDEIQVAGEFARDLVRQLLAYSGSGPVLREDVDVVERVSTMVDLLRGLAKTSNVTLSFAAESSISIKADPTHIGQVLMNLVTNAIDACDTDGDVDVTVRESFLDEANIDGMMTSPFFSPGRFLEIQVRDNGKGISDEHLNRIFEPYFTTRSHGSGLGLAAIKGIIDGQAGALSLSSTVGQGTLFRAFLPLTGRDEMQQRSNTEVRGKVLLVDDDPLVLNIISRALEQARFQTVESSSVTDARELLESDSTIELVLSDLNLRSECGLDLKDQTGTTAAGRPLVFMSSYRVQDIDGLGEIPLLSKPFDFNQVVTTLESTLRTFKHRPEAGYSPPPSSQI